MSSSLLTAGSQGQRGWFSYDSTLSLSSWAGRKRGGGFVTFHEDCLSGSALHRALVVLEDIPSAAHGSALPGASIGCHMKPCGRRDMGEESRSRARERACPHGSPTLSIPQDVPLLQGWKGGGRRQVFPAVVCLGHKFFSSYIKIFTSHVGL